MFPRPGISNVSHDVPTNGEVSGSSADYGDAEEASSAKFHSDDDRGGNVPNGLGNGEVSNAEEDKEEEIDEDDSSDENESCVPPFSVRSIQVAASTIGIGNLASDVAGILVDELCYKVKELIFVSKMVMQQDKRRHLTKSSVSRALSMLGGISLPGAGDDSEFVPIPPAGVFAREDPEIDTVSAALTPGLYTHRPEPYIQAQWLLPDGYLEDSSNPVEPSPYYTKISKAILNGKPSHLKLALRDLQSNPKIGPFCPFFLNLVALTVKNVKRDIPLTNALIATAHAIAHNRYVEPSPYLAINRAANSLLKIVNEVDVHKNYDDLSVRTRAGLLLAKVVEVWKIGLPGQIDIITYLLQHLLDPSIPLQSHYGAIVTLTALGQKTYDYVWPVIVRYLPVLEGKENSESYLMVQYVIGAVMAALRITRKRVSLSSEQTAKLAAVEELLYFRYGESIMPLRLAWMEGVPIVTRAKSKREPSCPKLRILQPSIKYKNTTYAVSRDLRFTKQRHRLSPAGDLFIHL